VIPPEATVLGVAAAVAVR
jgi:hypothetical protein